MRKSSIILLLFFFINMCFSHAQDKQHIIDSLKSALQTASDKDKPSILNSLAEYHIRDPKEAVNFAQQANEIAIANKDIEGQVNAQKYLAYANYFLQEPKTSLLHAEKCYELALESNDSINQSVILNIIGSINYALGDYKKALEFWEKCLVVREALGLKKDIAEVSMNIGVIYKNQGNYQKAIEYYQKNLKIREEIQDTSGMAQTLSNIGNIYYYFAVDYNKALDYYHQSLDYFWHEADTQSVSSIMLNIGFVYKEQQKFDEAKKSYQESLSLAKKINDKLGIAQAQSGLSYVYIKEKRYDEAIDFLQNSMSIYESQGKKKEVATANRDLGKIYSEMGKYKLALKHYNMTLIAYKEIELKKEVFELYKDMSDAYKAMGDYKSALEVYEKYSGLKDSTISNDYLEIIQEMETKYDTEKKEQAIAQMEEKKALDEKIIRQQKLMNYFFIGIIVLIGGFLFLVFRQNKQIKVANIKLEEQNDEITNQRDQIFHQKQEIEDSIHYASRIQTAIMPPEDEIHGSIADHFILWKPRDIVSGDFYWLTKKESKIIVTAADCTGHGVPGAFMSMLGVSFLNEIVNKEDITDSEKILNKLRENIVKALHQTGEEGEAKDGMDIALSVIDTDKLTLQFSGAYNPCIIIRDEEIIEIKGCKMPIGIHTYKNDDFKRNDFQLQKGDTIYMFSDGYVDQFGGEKGKKFMSKRFKQMLCEIQDMPLAQQSVFLNKTIEDWMADLSQIDDILVVGIRV